MSGGICYLPSSLDGPHEDITEIKNPTNRKKSGIEIWYRNLAETLKLFIQEIKTKYLGLMLSPYVALSFVTGSHSNVNVALWVCYMNAATCA